MSNNFAVYYYETGLDDYQTHVEALKRAESFLDDYRCNATDGWVDEVGELCVAIYTHHTVKVDERPRTEDDMHVNSDCEFVCEYELHATPEWQRIQDRLKRCDELEAGLNDLKKRLANKINQTKDYGTKNPSDRAYAESQLNGLRIANDFIEMCFSEGSETK